MLYYVPILRFLLFLYSEFDVFVFKSRLFMNDEVKVSCFVLFCCVVLGLGHAGFIHGGGLRVVVIIIIVVVVCVVYSVNIIYVYTTTTMRCDDGVVGDRATCLPPVEVYCARFCYRRRAGTSQL